MQRVFLDKYSIFVEIFNTKIMNYVRNDHLPNSVYHAETEHLSSTSLKLLKKSPKHYLHYKNSPKVESPALAFGSKFHDFCELGAVNFFQKYTLVNEPINPKTGKAYGTETQAYKEAFIGIENPILASEEKQILTMFQNIVSNKLVFTAFQHSIKEASFFVEYENVKLKFRPDGFTENLRTNLMYDIKTCADISEFEKDILKYNYHISAAMYVLLYEFCTGIKLDFFWFVVEKSEPYDARVFKLSDAMFLAGAKEFTTLLNLAKETILQNYFPGSEIWNETKYFTEAFMPAWYKSDYFFNI